MTPDLISGSKQCADPGPRRDFGLLLALVLASLASVVAAVFAASGARADDLSFGASLPVAFAARDAEPDAIEAQPVTTRMKGLNKANVEALIHASATKYRVSSRAMRELVDTAYAEARRNELDPLLIIAVMAVESSFNPIAQSGAGATGLMQVIPRYHSDKFSAADGESVLDPRINIKVGAQALKEYIVQGGTEVAGLQRYNGASGDASNAYANKVLAERARLQVTIRRARERIGTGVGAMG
jgi:soluble lytic murein transglycosylase-like protein